MVRPFSALSMMALLTSAARHPEIDYLGVEVHEPGIGHLLSLIERAGKKLVG